MVYILMVNANMFADPFGDGSNPLGSPTALSILPCSYQLVPSCATAAALIYVGLLMMSVQNIAWDNFKISVPTFLTLALMPFTYNIS